MNIEEIIGRLAAASDAELAEVLAAIDTQAAAVPTELTTENVESLERFASAKAAVKAEQGSRAELAARGDAARAAFTSTEDAADATTEDADKGTEDGAADDAGTDDAGDAVTASAMGAITRAKNAKSAAPAFAGAVRSITRSVGSTATFANGVELDRISLSQALAEKQSNIHRTGVSGRQTVSRTEFVYPPERTLSSTDSLDTVNAKIKAVTGKQAITAAGGLCAPLENLYDIPVIGSTERPVRDGLPRFQITRGGIQFRPSMDALAMTDGLGIWDAATDASVSNPPDGTPAKTCAVIECPALDTATVEAIYLCLQYPNFTARFDPEWVDATTEAAGIAQARFSENNLLAQMLAGSKLLTAPKAVSAVRDVLVNIDKTVAYYRNRHRLNTLAPLRLILPRWVLDLFRADLTRGLGSAHDVAFLAMADSVILGWFKARGVNVSWHLDGLAGTVLTPPGAGLGTVPQQFYSNAAAGAVIPPFIDKIDSVLFAEGDWLFLDGGTLDLGLVRDSALNQINRYQTFIETWEGLAFRGIESLRLLMEVQPTGSVTGTIDGSAFVD